MAGASTRFSRDGYNLPKYMLYAHGYSLFYHAISSFKKYFENTMFQFIARDISGTNTFIHNEVKLLGIKNYAITNIDKLSSGQAETVYYGLKKIRINKETPLTIFNIDTLRKNFIFPSSFDLDLVDGFLEVFEGEGQNWSYIKVKSYKNKSVQETSEKNPISNLCCNGLYHFKNIQLYCDTFLEYKMKGFNKFGLNEFYVAPMYNLILENGGDIRFSLIMKSQVEFFGTPKEFLIFKSINSQE
jgi:hypothetical protein